MGTHDTARTAIEHACGTARSLPELFAGVAEGLARAVPADAFCLNSLDPATLRETFAHHDLRPDPAVISRFFEIEAGGQDVNPARALAADPLGAATLYQATGGNPTSSARYRDVLRPLGLDHELRVLARDRRVPWGMLNLFRATGSPDFSTGDIAFVASLGRTVADGIRRTLVLGAADARPDDVGPGILVADLSGRIRHRSPTAGHWLADLDDVDWHVARVVSQAVEGAAMIHVCGRNGRWVSLHAEPYGDSLVSVVVEPARPARVAAMIVEAYGLSVREREVVRLLAGGYTNTEMSRVLGLSRHTVGDHVKSVFGKLAVHSRTELTARLFATVDR